MKKHKLALILAALTILSTAACDGPHIEDQPEPPVVEEPENEIAEPIDISSEYSLEVSSEMIKAGENLTVNIASTSDREITVAWESTDHNVLSVTDGVFTGVGAGFADISAKISAEGCKEFQLTYTVEVKPENYTLALIDNFILITDFDTRNPEELPILSYILNGGRSIIVGAASDGFTLKRRNSKFEESPYEILIGETNREESIGAGSDLGENEYSIKTVITEDGMKLLVNAKSATAMMFAYESLVDNLIYTEEGSFVPSDLDIKDKAPITQTTYSELMIETDTSFVRDPCVIYYEEEDLYYMIGSGFNSIGYGVATSEDIVHWSAPFSVSDFSEIPDYDGDCWAPEMHYYNGSYYITATYKSSVTGFRGCAIFKADSPKGPFKMITDGHLTSKEWNAIDGTLYVDDNGDPWFVYVREWISAPNEIGTFEAARLSDDLTHLISEPVELFKADEPVWATSGVTDGCWFYKMESTGSLIMLWSNWDDGGYCIGMARSESGDILGPWEHITQRLYSKTYSGMNDGGHGAIFTTKEGQLMVSFHCPNDEYAKYGNPHAFIMPIEEDPINDMLVIKQN